MRTKLFFLALVGLTTVARAATATLRCEIQPRGDRVVATVTNVSDKLVSFSVWTCGLWDNWPGLVAPGGCRANALHEFALLPGEIYGREFSSPASLQAVRFVGFNGVGKKPSIAVDVPCEIRK